MATARVEGWPGGPESRAYTADGDVNRPPGWEPPAPEHRERIARLIRERQAADNQRHVRDQVAERDPSLARALGALFEREDLAGREPRQQRGRAGR